MSDAQRDHPERAPVGDEWAEVAGRFLLGLADLLAAMIVKLREFGAVLIDRAQACVSPTEAS